MIKLKVGDKVRVYRKVTKFPDNCDEWVEEMDETVGMVGEVFCVNPCGDKKITVYFDEGYSYNYPHSALAHVK